MRNLEHHAFLIVFDLITKPNHTQLITYKPLADMVEKMLQKFMELAKPLNTMDTY